MRLGYAVSSHEFQSSLNLECAGEASWIDNGTKSIGTVPPPRVSHRIAVSQSVQHGLDIESVDIATAFLQGLQFQDVVRKAMALGHEHRQTRKVWLCPPANVWRHLREEPGSLICVDDLDIMFFAVELLKAIYGLVDGPLLFQLALLEPETHT